jgi:hypothetical protein
MYMLGRGISKDDVSKIFDNVSFIVFNYDRCVEHFLYHGLQKLYGIGERDAAAILAELNIIHPYGQVGDYLDGVAFGATSADYYALAQGIKTYTEQIAAGDLMAQIEAEFHRAECIVFLGFAYHSQNMRLLKPSVQLNTKNVFGTAKGMSDADTNVVVHQIAEFFKSMTGTERDAKLKLENRLTAAGLFDEYAKSLTGGD